MARNSKIRFQWDYDRPGRLLAIRDKGKITFPDLLEAINAYDVDFQSRIFSLQFIVDRDRIAPIGFMDEDEPEGDVWELWEAQEGEPCPLCGKEVNLTYCPHCGKPIWDDGDVKEDAQ